LSESKNSAIDRIVKYAVDSGYTGFRSGKFHFKGRTSTSASTTIKGLMLSELLSQNNEMELLGVLTGRPVDVGLALESISIPEPKREVVVDRNFETIHGELVQGGKVQENSLRNQILLFKSVRIDAAYDPKAKNLGTCIIALNQETREIMNNPSLGIDGILQIKGMTREEAIMSPNVPHCWPMFNPYTPDLTFKCYPDQLGNIETVAINTAVPPKWMALYSKKCEPKFRGFIKDLMVHLFPDEVDREKVLDWCHYAVFSRNGTVLCLAGDRGTGKSTFVEILSNLVGLQYSEIVNEAILKDKFNSQFRNKRLIIFEEVALSDSKDISKIKAWCNAKISIERKGEDAFSAENFASMVFLLNELRDLKVEPQERRFSIPVIAEENLQSTIPRSAIAEFLAGLRNESEEALHELAEFGLFLRERKPGIKNDEPIKGAHFERISELSLEAWKVKIRDFIREHGEIGIPIPVIDIFSSRLKEDKDKTPQKSTIDNFLRDYRELGIYKIADVVDLNPTEIEKYSRTKARRGGGPGNTRMYAVIPREDYLLARGIKYKQKVEDLL
jgi:energy-coupling factor transporter ATP-binding protein EcfA2